MNVGGGFTQLHQYIWPMYKWSIVLVFGIISCQNNLQNLQAQPSANSKKESLSPEQQLQFYKDTLRFLCDSLVNNHNFSGGILVAKNGQVLYEHYQGYADAMQLQPINDSTPFQIASTTKTFTSHAILQLMQQGKLQLDDLVQKYFNYFPYPAITIRHLLTHTSGLPDYVPFFETKKKKKLFIANNYDVLQHFVTRQPKLEFAVGSRFKYCNTNFVFLAILIEKISGLTYPQYLQQFIFEPAGMRHSFVLTTDNAYRYMLSFSASKKTYFFEAVDAVYGDKNVYSTCHDLMLYDAAIRKNILLDSTTYQLAWQPFAMDKHYGDSIEYYGLGWRLKLWPNGNKIVYHNGWWHGHNSAFQRLVQDSVVIIATGNVLNKNLYKVRKLADVFRPYYQQATPITEPYAGEEQKE